MPRIAWAAALIGSIGFVAACYGVWWVADTVSEMTGWPG